MIKPFQFYVDTYNMVGRSRQKADYRFSKQSWMSLMQYRQREIDDAVDKALKLPKVELLAELSEEWEPLVCLDCSEKSWIGGAAMTNYDCDACKRSEMWGSTATPSLCRYCAFNQFKCLRCGESRTKELAS